jgi:hypothetical protein
MASGGYLGGVLFDMSLSYTSSFLLAGISGLLNLAVIGALMAMGVSSPTIAGGSKTLAGESTGW